MQLQLYLLGHYIFNLYYKLESNKLWENIEVYTERVINLPYI